MKKLLLLSALSVVLAGCVSTHHTNSNVSSGNLSKASDSAPIVLKDRMTSFGYLGLVKYRYESVLAEGTYRPEYENDEGIWYQGPIGTWIAYPADSRNWFANPASSAAAASATSIDRSGFQDGGLWVSKCSNPKFPGSRKVLPYAYQDDPHHNGDAASRANDEAESRKRLGLASAASPPSTPLGGAASGAGFGLVELIIYMGKGKPMFIDKFFTPEDLDKLSTIISAQLAPCTATDR